MRLRQLQKVRARKRLCGSEKYGVGHRREGRERRGDVDLGHRRVMGEVAVPPTVYHWPENHNKIRVQVGQILQFSTEMKSGQGLF